MLYNLFKWSMYNLFGRHGDRYLGAKLRNLFENKTIYHKNTHYLIVIASLEQLPFHHPIRIGETNSWDDKL